jgi:hypothetical protein
VPSVARHSAVSQRVLIITRTDISSEFGLAFMPAPGRHANR